MRKLFLASAAMMSAVLFATIAATTPIPSGTHAKLDGYGVSVAYDTTVAE